MWPNTTFPGGEGPVTFVVVTIWLAGVQFGGKEITQALQMDPESPGPCGSWLMVWCRFWVKKQRENCVEQKKRPSTSLNPKPHISPIFFSNQCIPISSEVTKNDHPRFVPKEIPVPSLGSPQGIDQLNPDQKDHSDKFNNSMIPSSAVPFSWCGINNSIVFFVETTT